MAVFQITTLQRHLQQECRNVYYYETITGNPSTSEWEDIADEIRGYFNTWGASSFSDQWLLYGITFRQVDTAGLPSFTVGFTAGDLAGTNAADALPPQNALLVSVKGNTTKPRNARTYYCGFVEDSQADGIWLSGVLTNSVTHCGSMAELNAAGTNALERVSVTWNTGGTAVTDYNNITAGAIQASSVVATQRRRRIGVGI
jgi:hypothetical protein